MTVAARGLTITANDRDKTYGESLTLGTSAFSTGAGELVNGDSVAAVSLASGGAAATAAKGDYDVTPSGAVAGTGTDLENYSISYEVGTLTVAARGLTITANDRDKTYGESLTLGTSAFSTGAGELVNGDSVAAVSLASGGAAATAAKGDYDVTPSGAVAGTGTDLENYSISYEVGTLTVAARGLTITANDRDKTYGESLTLGTSAFSTGAGELVNGDSVAAVSLASGGAAATAAKGDYDVTPSGAVAGTGTDLENYSISYEVGTLTVAARGLTITANDRDKTYGESLTLGTSAFSTGAGELVNGDSVAAVSLASGGAAATAAKGDYDVTPSGAVAGTGTDLENYSISYEVGTLTVAARGLTITANDRDKTYGESLTLGTSAFSTGAGELVNGDSVAAVSLASGGAAATAAKGDYDVTPSGAVAGTGTDLENYSISYEVGTLTVAARAITVTADVQTKVYGHVDPALSYAVTSGSLANDDEFTGGLARAAGESVSGSPYAIGVGTLSVGSNYTLSYVGANLTITQRPITVTADPKSKTYGNADPTLTYSVTTGSMVGTDGFTGSLERAAGESVSGGPYAIGVGTLSAGSNYNLNYVGANLTITQRPITVTADPKSKTYGNADPTLTYSVTTGSMVDTDGFTGSLARDDGESVGTYAIRRNSLSAGSNYDLTYAGANLTITQRPITVTADPQSKTYGNADPTLTYSVTTGSMVGTDGFTGSLERAAGESVSGSPYAIGVGTLSAGSNYTLSYVGANLTITQRPITVTADPQSKTYGNADPTLTYSVTTGSMVGTDGFTGSLARAAGESVSGGPYAIGVGTLSAGSNYNLTYAGANLTINERPITVTAAPKSKTYGNADPALTYSVTTGSMVGTDGFTGSLVRAAGTSVGTYAIGVGSLSAGSNYILSYVGANLTITQRPITVTAAPKSKTYGNADPALTYSVTPGNLVTGDTFSGALARAAGESVGTYAISQGSLSAGSNYNLTYAGANLTITPKGLTVTAAPKSKLLGAADPALTYSVTSGSLVAGDVFTGALDRVPGETVGSYAIRENTLTAGPNYTVTYVGAQLKILFGWAGYLQPINDTAHQIGTYESKFKLGQTIPVKFDLTNAAGQNVQQVGGPTFTRSVNLGACDSTATPDAVPTVTPDGTGVFSYNGGHYQYNWSTKGISTSGEYLISATLADGTIRSVYICLTK